MKREEIKAIFADATDEQLKQILDINGADIEKVKSKVTALEADLKSKKEDFDKLNKELDALKAKDASGAEWKAKYDAIVAENEAKAKQAEADRILAAKQEATLKRFEAVTAGKKFYHEAVREAYLKKFGEAIEAEENKAKSDADVFHALTKDDAHAFEGVTVRLAGGKPTGATSGKYTSREEIFKIKNAVERQREMVNHPDLFPEISE